MRRAYNPRHSTRELVRRIRALDGVARVDIIAPHRGVTITPARLKVTLDSGTFTIFTLPEARAWLATEPEHGCDCGKGEYCPQYGKEFKRS